MHAVVHMPIKLCMVETALVMWKFGKLASLHNASRTCMQEHSPKVAVTLSFTYRLQVGEHCSSILTHILLIKVHRTSPDQDCSIATQDKSTVQGAVLLGQMVCISASQVVSRGQDALFEANK